MNGGPFHGYLRVEDTHLEIITRSEDASILSVYKKEGCGLRVTYRGSGEHLVVATTKCGRALILGSPAEMNNGHEWFEITQARNIFEKDERELARLSCARFFLSFFL